jgi:hypothetical protein
MRFDAIAIFLRTCVSYWRASNIRGVEITHTQTNRTSRNELVLTTYTLIVARGVRVKFQIDVSLVAAVAYLILFDVGVFGRHNRAWHHDLRILSNNNNNNNNNTFCTQTITNEPIAQTGVKFNNVESHTMPDGDDSCSCCDVLEPAIEPPFDLNESVWWRAIKETRYYIASCGLLWAERLCQLTAQIAIDNLTMIDIVDRPRSQSRAARSMSNRARRRATYRNVLSAVCEIGRGLKETLKLRF